MNKKTLFRITLALIAYAVFVVLVINFYDDSPANMDWEDRESFNQQYVTKVQLDKLTFDKVISDLGSPDITEAKKIAADYYQLSYYRTQHVKSDGITTKEECTPLLFHNGMLIALGSSAEQAYLAL